DPASGRRRRVREAAPLAPIGNGSASPVAGKGGSFVSDDSGAASSGRGDSAAVFDLPEAARLLGGGRSLAYKVVGDGEWPTPVVRIGRLIKVPKKPLLDYLGADA